MLLYLLLKKAERSEEKSIKITERSTLSDTYQLQSRYVKKEMSKVFINKSRIGELTNFTDDEDPYEEPQNFNLKLDTSKKSISQ